MIADKRSTFGWSWAVSQRLNLTCHKNCPPPFNVPGVEIWCDESWNVEGTRTASWKILPQRKREQQNRMAGRGDWRTAVRVVSRATVRVDFRRANGAKTCANRENDRLVILS